MRGGGNSQRAGDSAAATNPSGGNDAANDSNSGGNAATPSPKTTVSLHLRLHRVGCFVWCERQSGSDRGLLSMVQQCAGGDSRGWDVDGRAVHGALAAGGCGAARVHVYLAGDGGDADGFARPAHDERRESVRLSDFGRARFGDGGSGGDVALGEWMECVGRAEWDIHERDLARNVARGGCRAGNLRDELAEPGG